MKGYGCRLASSQRQTAAIPYAANAERIIVRLARLKTDSLLPAPPSGHPPHTIPLGGRKVELAGADSTQVENARAAACFGVSVRRASSRRAP